MDSTPLNELLEDVQQLKQLGYDDEAFFVLEEISELYPECIDSYLEQVDILLNRGESSEQDVSIAVEKTRKALALDIDNLDANYYMGYLFALKRQWDKALPYLERSAVLESDDTDVLRMYGWVLFHLGREQEGISSLKKSIALDDHFVEAMEDLAECYLHQGKIDVALLIIERALTIAGETDRLIQLQLVAASM